MEQNPRQVGKRGGGFWKRPEAWAGRGCPQRALADGHAGYKHTDQSERRVGGRWSEVEIGLIFPSTSIFLMNQEARRAAECEQEWGGRSFETKGCKDPRKKEALRAGLNGETLTWEWLSSTALPFSLPACQWYHSIG